MKSFLSNPIAAAKNAAEINKLKGRVTDREKEIAEARGQLDAREEEMELRVAAEMSLESSKVLHAKLRDLFVRHSSRKFRATGPNVSKRDLASLRGEADADKGSKNKSTDDDSDDGEGELFSFSSFQHEAVGPHSATNVKMYLAAYDHAAATRKILTSLIESIDDRLSTDPGAITARVADLEKRMEETKVSLEAVREKQFKKK